MSNSNSDEPRRRYITHSPPPPSLSSLPGEIVLRCLALVPRSHHLTLSLVSKQLRSLARSPELNGLRSIRRKKSLYVCFGRGYNDLNGHWFTLRPSEETGATEYRLVPNPHHGSSTVALGSKIFFIGGSREPSSYLWILDTRSGNMTQGPSMSQGLDKSGRKEMLVYLVCVVEDVLFAFFNPSGIMWFDTKLNVWRRLLGSDGKELPLSSQVDAMAEYDDGKLVVLYMLRKYEVVDTVTKGVLCMLAHCIELET